MGGVVVFSKLLETYPPLLVSLSLSSSPHAIVLKKWGSKAIEENRKKTVISIMQCKVKLD
jgi:hypothetical protein